MLSAGTVCGVNVLAIRHSVFVIRGNCPFQVSLLSRVQTFRQDRCIVLPYLAFQDPVDNG